MITREYIKFTRKTAIYPKEFRIFYPCALLTEEIVECRKALLDDKNSIHPSDKVISEFGDVLWGLARLLDDTSTEVPEIDLKGNYFQVGEFADIGGMIGKYMAKKMRDKESDITPEHVYTEIMFLFKSVFKTLYIGGYLFNDIVEEALNMNIEKLTSRKNRGVLGGSGDNR